uniref:Uncharacterized protein n=1 Tax=Eutreptiella gymnastica TaxID=73025 RepID=A0A7S1IT43_9EUGL|mmetsp:Transcript_40267/g.71928  ORF Transcript_40267/g.71928 Transcript_40267/m.71928 type:complete len:866 (+) Transcript_40267:54-2651(+)
MPAKAEGADDTDKAAFALWEAEYLVIVAGPSFYEPPHHTVFAKESCDPLLLQQNRDKFYGFWGDYYNRYTDRHAHDGYSILKKWRDNYFDAWGVDMRRKGGPPGKKGEEEPEEPLQRIYAVTAAVDGSFIRAGFSADEVYEISGNISNWQCWVPCKPEVWTIDPHFRFDVDPDTKLAKAVKWVDDVRPPVTQEVWTVVDDDDESLTELPAIVHEAKGKTRPMNDVEKRQRAAEMQKQWLNKLQHATAVHLYPETQEQYPNMEEFRDCFTATPTSSYIQPVTYTFPSGRENRRESTDLLGLPEEAPPPTEPLQPYILKPRVSHYLAHVLGLHYGKNNFHQGIFDQTSGEKEKQARHKAWQDEQRFFDPTVPAVEMKRKQHIFYNISLCISDPKKPAIVPKLVSSDTLIKDAIEASSDVGDGDFEDEAETSFLPVFSPDRAPSAVGFIDRMDTTTGTDIPRDTTSISIASPLRADSAQPLSSPMSPLPPTNVDHSVTFESSDAAPEPWDQGKGGRYYFSYVPVMKTHVDPSTVMYDTIRIDVPDGAMIMEDTLPTIGKISCVVECCELPEPKSKAKEDPKDKKKKKDEPKVNLADIKLDPVLEPTQYSATQIIGRIMTKSLKQITASPGKIDLAASQQLSRANLASMKNETINSDVFEYRLTTKKGHVLSIGARYSDPRTIRYIEIEVPISDAADRDLLRSSVHCEMKVMPEVDLATTNRLAAKKKKKSKPRPVPNHQLCINCGECARPNVVMDPKKDIRAINPPKKPYQTWEGIMAKQLRNTGGSLVILEMGCEKKPDASRKLSEKLYKLCKNSGRCTFVRLSTEDLEKKGKAGAGEGDKMVSIVGPVLNSLMLIDRRMMEMKRRK